MKSRANFRLTTLKKVAFTLLCCTVLMVFAASAQTIILQENFDELTDASAVTSAGAFTAINGTNIDIVGPGYFPGLCVSPESGSCVDLDGSNGNNPQGDIESGPITLNPGITYTLSFDLIGSQRGDNGTSTTVTFGSYYSQTFNLASNDVTTGIVSFQFTVPSTDSAYLEFKSNTPGNVGALLDNVSITASTQEMLTVTELGTGIGTVTDDQTPQQINCTEANGIQQPGSTCTGKYPPGTMVTLTAAPSSAATSITPTPVTVQNGSTFLGWVSGPCAGSTLLTCSFTITSSQTVTADFAPTPSPVRFTINAGTNVIAQAQYACPSGSSPCTDPNAYGFSVQFPVVSTSFPDNFYIDATEVYADGLCPTSGTTPTSSTTLGDFDCRFASFWNYGTDNAGNTVVPLCDAYANGNCVHFYVYYNLPGTEPPLTSYTGPLFETFSFTNSTFSPGSYWAGSTTRAIADPDADEITPSVPWGTNCELPMYTEGSQTPPAINCQFDADVTAFLGSTGGKTNQANDFVVAFQPTSTAPGNVQTPPTPVAPTIAGSCVTGGCTVNGDPTITFTEGTGGTFDVTVPAPTYPTPYPAPNLTASTTGTTTTASEAGGIVTLTASGTFGSQSLVGDMVVVSNCTPTGFNGTFPILSASAGAGGTTLTYADSATGLTGGGTGCNVLVLPAGLKYDADTGLVSGTPADGTSGSYPVTFTAANGVPPTATLSYTLMVGPATLNISASASTTYGATTPPVITTTVTGLVNGDSPSIVSCSSAVTSSSPAGGSYPISCTVSASSTYNVSCTTNCGYVTVNRAPLTITASSATMIYGASPPTISPTFTLNGLVNNDTALTLGVTCSTTATSTSLPGTYPSSCTASNGGNYTITPVNGTVTVVGLQLSTSTVNFGTLYLGQIGIQGIILKNTSAGPITISSINLAGGTAPGDYGDLSFCPPMIVKLPATLPAGKSCAIGLGILASVKVFNPTPSTTTLTIVDSAASQPVLLTALVINPQAAFSSTYLSSGKLTFPTTLKGNSNQQTITVTNPGNTPLILGNPAISVSSSSGYFTLTGTTCNGTTVDTTSEGGVTSCAITVTFAPKGTGTFTGTVKINDNAWSGRQTISLSGTT